jgi:hypothetical protein
VGGTSGVWAGGTGGMRAGDDGTVAGGRRCEGVVVGGGSAGALCLRVWLSAGVRMWPRRALHG